ncbi:MAG TPA: HDOD domain-containing protein [Burkholderiaceae bacterium]|nr:HDOD domain-containing protein [Burkholderiaceae bacterium]
MTATPTRDPSASPSTADAGEPTRAVPTAFLGRQPILDRNQQLIGYELLYRGDLEATEARFADGEQASLVVIATLLQELGADQVLGGKTAFVNVGPGSLGEDSPVTLLDPKRTVLEFSPPTAADEATLAALAELRRRGFGVAVNVESPATLKLPVFAIASHVKVDLTRVPMEQLPLVVKLLKAAGGRRMLLAEKVETREQASACLAHGFDCLQGYYFAHPETLSTRKLEPARAAVMQAIKLLLRNADVIEIDNALKRDVALSVKLLRYMNSAGMGLSARIDSLKHAIQLLGYAKLARWLTMLLATADSKDPTAPLLARTAITRGRMMELLGETRFDVGQRDNLFIVGTFSLLPAMLMVPMKDALQELELPEPVTDALLERSGDFAPYLRLAEACESPSLSGVAQLCKQLDVAPRALNLAQMQATDWVNQLGI